MTPVLEAERLSFGFGSRPVFRDISLRLTAGERVGLVGANGAGKSTLLWCLLGLLRPKGTVRLFGAPPSPAALARVGVVFQNPEDQLFMPCLLEDLTLGLLNRRMPREEARRRALAALGEVGLEEYGGAPAAHLSLGQRKRASLALALAPEPELLVLDEPTAELDGRSVRRLAGLLRRLPGAHLVASHHLEFLRETADQIGRASCRERV